MLNLLLIEKTNGIALLIQSLITVQKHQYYLKEIQNGYLDCLINLLRLKNIRKQFLCKKATSFLIIVKICNERFEDVCTIEMCLKLFRQVLNQ